MIAILKILNCDVAIYIGTYMMILMIILFTCKTGEYRGLINSRNTSQKFDSHSNEFSKWFPNANLCGKDDVWQKYANFHASVLSGKQKGKYLIYECMNRIRCGGYGNRIHGITECHSVELHCIKGAQN